MDIQVSQIAPSEVMPLRELYRKELNCQIVHDSWLGRGFGDAYLIRAGGRVAGYAAVANRRSDKGTVFEFYTLPDHRTSALPLFRQLLAESQATKIRAQTNDRLMLLMLYDCARSITSDTILFEDALTTHHACRDGILRRVTAEDADRIFKHKGEPVGDWMIESENVVVATGGAYFHYNPPYGDIFMEVHESYRRRGYGTYLVQELKRICYEIGKIPAARCNTSNFASRGTLQKAGFLPCARVLVGRVPK